MAKLNICDLCKKPGETAFRLSLFKKDGKKHLEKRCAEICEACNKKIVDAVDSPANTSAPIFLPATFGAPVQQGPYGYVVGNPALPKAEVPRLQPQAEDKGDGVYRVAPALSKDEVRARNKGAEATPKKEGCKHLQMSMDDSTMRVVCKACGMAMEDT